MNMVAQIATKIQRLAARRSRFRTFFLVGFLMMIIVVSLNIWQRNYELGYSIQSMESVIKPLVETSTGTLDELLKGLDADDIKKEDNANGSTELMRDPVIEEIKETTKVHDYVNTYPENDLRSRLSKKFVYDQNSTIPKRIFQVWSEPFAAIKDPKVRRWISTWTEDREFQHILLTDEEVEFFLSETYGDFPEILDTYKTLPLNILRYDFVRYLLIYANGGTYTDIDTSAIASPTSWADISLDNIGSFATEDIGFVAGIEADYDLADWKYKSSRRVQFCQWTFKSRKGHPILRELISTIVKVTLESYNERLSHVKIYESYHTLHSVYTILNWTGPGAFTDAVFNHLNMILRNNVLLVNENLANTPKYTEFESYHQDRNFVDLSKGKYVGWRNFTRVRSPISIDDVMILPINSFNGFTDDLEFAIDNSYTYVKHEFNGSWKDL